MNDMSSTIVAKSDQINAADLVGTARTITIREVKISPSDDQPVSVMIEGDQKAFRPCKGVRRLMVRVWGADASKYVGQSMTLFNDPKVTWAEKCFSQLPTAIDPKDFEKWLILNKLDVVLFNEQHSWQPVLACRPLGIITGAYIDYYTEQTVPFFGCYDFLVCV